MNVVLKLFTLRSGRYRPAEALARLGLLVVKSGSFPFLPFLYFLLSHGNGPARFIVGADTPKPGWPAQQNMQLQQPGASKIWMACRREIWFVNMSRKFTS